MYKRKERKEKRKCLVKLQFDAIKRFIVEEEMILERPAPYWTRFSYVPAYSILTACSVMNLQERVRNCGVERFETGKKRSGNRVSTKGFQRTLSDGTS